MMSILKMVKKDYSSWSKEQLASRVRELEKRKKYGLVWDEEKGSEQFETESKEKLPVLKEVKDKEIGKDKNKPSNILIEGDNYHALSVLNYTHKGKIDAIYIDPPYNTGSENFIYNDNRYKTVEEEDPYRHSKWLAFMNRRLRLARDLLKDRGVIFISIDDHELFQLKLLCDEIFGENNFLGNIIWQTATDNNPSQIAVEHEYILAYSKNKTLQPKWFGNNQKATLINNRYLELKKEFSEDLEKIQKELKKWIRENKNLLEGVAHYSYVDEIGVYYPDNPSNPHPGGYKYSVPHPVTKKSCRIPPNGYRWPEKTFIEMRNRNEIDFGEDESITPKPKKRLLNAKELLRSVYYEDNRNSTNELAEIMGKKVFDNPKSPYLIKYLLSFTTKNNFIILDFFAGSGTTGQSVGMLNKEDGGNRKFILCTNNENKICEDVCYPRIKKVIEGYKNSDGEKVEGLGGNLKYFKTDFVDAEPTDKNKIKLTKEATEMLCLKEDTFESVVEKERFKIFRNGEKYTGIILDHRGIKEFKKAIKGIKGEFSIYVFSVGDDTFEEEFEDLTQKFKLSPIPEVILRVYRRIFNKL